MFALSTQPCYNVFVREFDNRISESLYHGRPDSAVPTLVKTFPNQGGGEVNVGFHLCVVRHPIRVVGYHLAGFNIPFSETGGEPPPPVSDFSKWRFAILRGHARLGVPTGAMLPNSDSGVRVAYDVGSNERDAIRVLPLGANTVEYWSVMLANPVIIESPGLYWIGVARMFEEESGEQYYGSFIPAYLRGLRDLLSNQSVATLETVDFAALVTINPSNDLSDQKFSVPAAEPEEVSICNIDIGLITQRWTNA